MEVLSEPLAPAARIVAVAAVTVDGKIARRPGQFSDWTSREDKDFLHSFLDSSDVVVVGHTTYRVAAEQLAKRNCIVFSRSVQTVEQRSDRLLFCNPSAVLLGGILSRYRTVAVLGGAQVYSYFLEYGLLDELYLTIEPTIFGEGLNLFERGTGQAVDLELVSAKQLNTKGSLLLHYRVPRRCSTDRG